MTSRVRARVVLTAIVVFTFLACGAARQQLARRAPEAEPRAVATVVSLAPSLTETVFALGVGERVVGVTRYCRFPPEARSRPEVGGYFDPNYEAILRLRPDLVVTLDEHVEARERLTEAGLRVATADHTSIEGILASMEDLGAQLDVTDHGQTMVQGLRARVDAVREAAAGKERPRVLVVVDREVGGGLPGKLYICGRDTYFDPMIRWAGGENAYDGPDVPYPLVTPEGLLRMNPDVIIDLVPPTTPAETLLAAKADWNGLPSLRALSGGRVHLWNDDYTMIPGPRFILALERLAEVLHPRASSSRDERWLGPVGRGVPPSRGIEAASSYAAHRDPPSCKRHGGTRGSPYPTLSVTRSTGTLS